jgi:hypothetical protein
MNTTTKKLEAPVADIEKANQVREASKSVAQAVRTLMAEWNDRGRTARALNIRYQWVRNVMVTPIGKKG